MRRFLLLITTLFIVFSLGFRVATPIYSQEEVSEEYKAMFAEYVKVIDTYNKSRELFVLKRSQYMSFKTLKSETEAYEATLAMLKARDDLYIMYIRVLTVRLNDAVGVSQERKDAIKVRLGNEVVWYEDHKNSLPSAGTLEDLVQDSNNARAHRQIADALFFETLVYISDGRVSDFNKRTQTALSDIKTKVSQIKAETRPEYVFNNDKLALIDRWIFESENRIVRSELKWQEAQADTSDLVKEGNYDSMLSTYNQIISEYSESQLYLKEANSYLGEVIVEMKRE